MLLLTIGFSLLSMLLCLNFFRKFSTRLTHYSEGKHYVRIPDYQGQPIRFHFDYPGEDGLHWESIHADVTEVFHYGEHYFVKGYSFVTKRTRLYKQNLMVNLKIESEEAELDWLRPWLKNLQVSPIDSLARPTSPDSSSRAA